MSLKLHLPTAAGRIWRKDYFAGMLMLCIGAVAVHESSNYELGTLNNIGPGFFPTIISCILIALGTAIALTASKSDDSAEEGPLFPDARGAIAILIGLIAFVVLGEHFGLLPATFGLVVVSAMGDRENSIMESIFLALGMCVIAVVIFSWALKMQFPLFNWS